MTAVDRVDMDGRETFGDSRLNSDRIIRFTHFCAILLIAFCGRPKTAGDVISGGLVEQIVHDKRVEDVRDQPFSSSREAAFSTDFELR